jgi:hypothetical protein
MKNQITVTLVDNKFVLTETRTVITETVLTSTDNTGELSTFISNSGYKNAKFSEDAKIEFKRLEREAKLAYKLKNDVKRQEREAKKAERKQAQEAKLIERMAKLQAQLEKVKSA